MFMSALGPSCSETWIQTPKAVWEDSISQPTPQLLTGGEQALIGHPRADLLQISNRGLSCQLCVCVFNPQ